VPESPEIVTELIEEDSTDSQTSYAIYAVATAVARVINIWKSLVIKGCVWSGMGLVLQLKFEAFSSAKHI
jgi:hypothetical protein